MLLYNINYCVFGLTFRIRSFGKKSPLKEDILEGLFLKEWFLFGLNMSKVSLWGWVLFE